MKQMMRVCGNEAQLPGLKRAIAYMLSVAITVNVLPTNPSGTVKRFTNPWGGRTASARPSEPTKNDLIPAISLSSKVIEYVDKTLDDVHRKQSHAEAVKTKPVARQYNIKRAEENLKPVVCDVSNVTNISNLSVDEMKETFKGTWLEGKEEDLYNFEHEYGINVFFMYGVSTLESGRGTSPLARNRQNYYGANVDRNWEDWNDSTNYFCDFMTRLYIAKDNTSVQGIGPIYCPPNPSWADEVETIMMDLYESVK